MIRKLPIAIPDEPATGRGNSPHNQVKGVDGDGHLKSRVIKRSLMVGGHKTSISLEEVFWQEFRAIAQERHLHFSDLAGQIDAQRHYCNLSSAIRLFVFENRCNRICGAHDQNEPLDEAQQISPTSTSEKRRNSYTKLRNGHR